MPALKEVLSEGPIVTLPGYLPAQPGGLVMAIRRGVSAKPAAASHLSPNTGLESRPCATTFATFVGSQLSQQERSTRRNPISKGLLTVHCGRLSRTSLRVRFLLMGTWTEPCHSSAAPCLVAQRRHPIPPAQHGFKVSLPKSDVTLFN